MLQHTSIQSVEYHHPNNQQRFLNHKPDESQCVQKLTFTFNIALKLYKQTSVASTHILALLKN